MNHWPRGIPPGKVYHQATMAIDPAFAGKGIGTQICELTAKRLIELNYDAYAVETSSESADLLAAKMKKKFKVVDLRCPRPSFRGSAIQQRLLNT